MPNTPDSRCQGDIRTELTLEAIRQSILDNLYYLLGRTPSLASPNEWYTALACSVRDRILKAWVENVIVWEKEKSFRLVAYLSAEFLIGPQLGSNLLALGITDTVRRALADLGQDLDVLLRKEPEPGLGNGGLGRLAACYLESLATLGVPATGYGIRYEFGMFKQEIHDGWQTERSDKWLRMGFPWEIARKEIGYPVKFGGRTEPWKDEQGRYRVRWLPEKVVRGVAYDMPVIGSKGKGCANLRLWSAEAVDSFDFAAFNVGNYYDAVHEKIFSETISKVLYPNDEPESGKHLRLGQQYFFVSCSIQDMIRLHLLMEKPLSTFHETFAIQLNDTHPALGVAELMRLLVDDHLMDWDTAWYVTCRSFNYTNHTLLPEALEKWAVPMFKSILPRHMEIIYEINARFLGQVRASHPGDEALAARVSLIDESGPRYVRMAHLATVGSQAVNGVAALHTELLKSDVLRDFAQIMPEKFHNVTNGVTPRRWLALCNPGLAELISSRLGKGWITHFHEEIGGLEPLAADEEFRHAWAAVKQENKRLLAKRVAGYTGESLDPASVFDVQVKRIHEYKRQHLNILRVMALYNRLKRNPGQEFTPRSFIFGGKAAPGYFLAKLIIKLINSVADKVNHDPVVDGRIKVVFFPDFNVKKGQMIYPAADISQQISLAGKEASGTGNMKFAMNGGLTIGTLDGANVEIRQQVGPENFFLFGLTAGEVREVRLAGYNPWQCLGENPALAEVMDQLASGFYANGDRELFKPLVDNLLYRDEYMVLKDFQAYLECQDRAMRIYGDRELWTGMSILTVARMGMFSSDRAVKEYCRDIWRVSAE
jgi:starch phosphorylase